MKENKIDLPFLILDKYAQLIDMKYFLYEKKDLGDVLQIMSPNRFLKEYTFQQKIAKGSLDCPTLNNSIATKYTLLVNTLENLKYEFDKTYPLNKFPEYYL